MQNTTNYNLNKPDGTDFAKIQALNDNADIVDSKLKELEDSSGLFTQHANNQQIHVTQAKQDSWDAKVNRVGDTMIGDLNIKKGLPSINLQTPNNTNNFNIKLNANDTSDYGVELSKNGQIFMRVSGQKDVKFFGRDDVWFSIQDLKSSVSNGKTAVANAITQKGVATSATAEFATMASNILAISTGKKFATGVANGSVNLENFVKAFNNETIQSSSLTVSNLDFKPSLILAADSVYVYVYQNLFSLDSSQTFGLTTDFTTINSLGTGSGIGGPVIKGTGGAGYVTNGGFKIPVMSNTIPINWIAIE